MTSQHRRWLRLASNRLFRNAAEPYVYPFYVDVSVEPAPAEVGIGEGDTFSAMGTTTSVAEALSGKWVEHFDHAEAAWLRPYLQRILDGQTVTEDELIAHFVRLHGREPEVTVDRRA